MRSTHRIELHHFSVFSTYSVSNNISYKFIKDILRLDYGPKNEEIHVAIDQEQNDFDLSMNQIDNENLRNKNHGI